MWGRRIGAVALADGARAAEFEYTPEFAAAGSRWLRLKCPR